MKLNNLSIAFLLLILLACTSGTGSKIDFGVYDIRGNKVNLGEKNNLLIILASSARCHDCFLKVDGCIKAWQKINGKTIRTVALVYDRYNSIIERRTDEAYLSKLLSCKEFYFFNDSCKIEKYATPDMPSPALFLVARGKIITVENEKMFGENVKDLYVVISNLLDHCE